MDAQSLQAEEDRLVFTEFSELTAIALGGRLTEIARAAEMPVVIDIRTHDRTLFHAALPGATPVNDLWARRKSATTLHFQASSLRVREMMLRKGDTLAAHGLSETDFALSGGSFPIRVRGAGVVAAVTVSGLPQVEDHALVLRGLEAMV